MIAIAVDDEPLMLGALTKAIKASPDIDCVEMICQVLGVTPNQLFGWEPYEEYNEYLSIMAKKQEELHYLEEQSKEIQSRIGDLLISIKTEEEKWRNS